MTRPAVAAAMLVVYVLALPARAYADCPSAQVDDVLKDPRVQEALDQAWRDSMEGTPDEHEEGGWVLQCQNINADGSRSYFTMILRWPAGDIEGIAPPYPARQSESCRTVATFHTHPGPDSSDPAHDDFENSIPSPEDYLSAANDGLPGIIRYGSGDDTTDFTYNYGTVGDEPREPGWGCPRVPPPASGHGDPHMLTLDGYAYDFMAIGDFVLATTTLDDIQIQARLQPYAGLKSAAITTGIAIRNRFDRVEWQLEGRQLIVNGTPRTLERGGVIRLRSRAVLRHDDEGLLLISTVGDRLRVIFNTGSLDYTLLAARARKAAIRGLFGDFDGDPDNDLRAAGGQLAAHAPADLPDHRRPLYALFGESWRVPLANTLFTTAYAAPGGVDVKTFPQPMAPPPPDARATAEAACKSAGVVDPVVFQSCVFDHVQAGNGTFVAAAARADRDIRDGVPLAVARAITVESDVIGRLENTPRDVLYPIELRAGTYLFDGRGSHGTSWRLEAANGDDFLAGMNEMAANPRRVTLPAGRYRLRVAIFPELPAGRFRFRVRMPPAPEVSTLAEGARASGRIDVPGQIRSYELRLEPGRYDFVPKSDGELWWSLTGSDGYERFDANQRVFMERASGLEITVGGVYTLSVAGREWAGTGSYEVGYVRTR